MSRLSGAPLAPGQPRNYRRLMAPAGLVRTDVIVGESDLVIFTRQEVRSAALRLLCEAREAIVEYIRRDPAFGGALRPVLPLPGAPQIVRRMIDAGAATGVGPMAAVAGVIAEHVALGLRSLSAEVIVENGGDIYIIPRWERRVAIWPGNTPPGLSLALAIAPEDGQLAICTSSGTLGHSLSFGKADAAVAVATDGALADAAATALGNLVQTAADIPAALGFARQITGLLGCVIIAGGSIGIQGPLKLVGAGDAAGRTGGQDR